MPFVWTIPISAGLLVEHTELAEIQGALDNLVDNIACVTYNAQHLTTYDLGIMATNDVGVQASNNSGILSSNDTSVESSNYTSNLSNNYVGVLSLDYTSNLDTDNSGVNTSNNVVDNNSEGDISCPSNYSAYQIVANILTGCISECGPGGNQCGGDWTNHGWCIGQYCPEDWPS